MKSPRRQLQFLHHLAGAAAPPDTRTATSAPPVLSGNGSSIVHAPPTRSRVSSTSTRFPARARYAAHARPLCPAPTTTTSHDRAASSRTGAGNPTFPRTAAVGDALRSNPPQGFLPVSTPRPQRESKLRKSSPPPSIRNRTSIHRPPAAAYTVASFKECFPRSFNVPRSYPHCRTRGRLCHSPRRTLRISPAIRRDPAGVAQHLPPHRPARRRPHRPDDPRRKSLADARSRPGHPAPRRPQIRLVE